MLNRPYLLNYTPMAKQKVLAVKAMGRAVLVNGKVHSAASGVGRVAHRKIVALALHVAHKEEERDRRERGVEHMTVEFEVRQYDGKKVVWGRTTHDEEKAG